MTNETSTERLTDSESTEAFFQKLVVQWKKETSHLSNIAARADNAAYQRIIAMGAAAVPLLLAELKREPDDWFWALHAITGVDPVPKKSRGDLPRMAAAWVRWGRKQGFAI